MHGSRRLLTGVALHCRRFGRVDIRKEIEAGIEIAVADGVDREIACLMTGKRLRGHPDSPDCLIACVNRRSRIAKTTNARLEAGTPGNRAIETFHEPVHHHSRTKRIEPIPDFRENGLAVSMPNGGINHVDMVDFRFEFPGAEFDAIAREFGKLRIGRHLVRANIESHVRHGDAQSFWSDEVARALIN
ncbi:hypothetical protein PT2222_110089 [Paraburkholderia tropica]